MWPFKKRLPRLTPEEFERLFWARAAEVAKARATMDDFAFFKWLEALPPLIAPGAYRW